jgi:hypothetical protein
MNKAKIKEMKLKGRIINEKEMVGGWNHSFVCNKMKRKREINKRYSATSLILGREKSQILSKVSQFLLA